MVCIGAKVLDLLMCFIDVIHELVGLNGPTIGELVLNDDTIVVTNFLKSLFDPDCFDCRKTELMLDVHIGRRMIKKQASSLVGGR
jgi:hypothetical protein